MTDTPPVNEELISNVQQNEPGEQFTSDNTDDIGMQVPPFDLGWVRSRDQHGNIVYVATRSPLFPITVVHAKAQDNTPTAIISNKPKIVTAWFIVMGANTINVGKPYFQDAAEGMAAAEGFVFGQFSILFGLLNAIGFGASPHSPKEAAEIIRQADAQWNIQQEAFKAEQEAATKAAKPSSILRANGN